MDFTALTTAHRWLLPAVLVLAACGPANDKNTVSGSEPADAGTSDFLWQLEQLTALEGDEESPTFSPDGRWVAFTSNASGNRDVMVLDHRTGDVRALATSDADEHHPEWSPDGTRLAFTSDAGGDAIWTIPVEGGDAMRLTQPQDRAFRPHWSPDGELIAFAGHADGSRQVWLVHPDGSGRRRLSSPPAEHLAYGWSPDGSSVLALSFGSDAQDIWSLPVNGDEPRRLTTREGEEWWPMWSPVGDRIVFYTTWDDAMTDIWTADVASGELLQITDLPVEDFRPAWSPDGRWLAFNSDRESKSGLWVTAADGSQPRAVATGGRAGGLPAWSPDGEALTFSYYVNPTLIYAVPTAGGTLEALTEGPHSAVEAVTSPDGRRVAFEADDVGSEADLFLLDLDTGEIQRLTAEVSYNARPTWSPDGNRLGFERSSGGGPRTNNVAILDIASGTIHNVTSTGYVRRPVWCGRHLVYSFQHFYTGEGPNQLWRVPEDGGDAVQLTTNPGDKEVSDCSADGRALLFTHNLDGKRTLWKATITDGGTLSDIESLGPGEGARWSPDGAEIAFLSKRDGLPDIYVAAADGSQARRITHTPGAESWPHWTGDGRLIFSANPGGRDVWMARPTADL